MLGPLAVLLFLVVVTRLSCPLCEPPAYADTSHAVTFLGISLFHVEGRDGRLACLKDFYRMLRPGGQLFVDNKGWDAHLREERDPITIYPLPDGRLLAATYEYPGVGEQVSHLQLMETGTCPGGRLHVVKRWTIRAFPVSTETLERELVEAGFEPAQVFDETGWPDDLSDGRGAYYQLLVARRPGA